jgi:DNA uptake protein ComE-like DNA-binding protein
MFTSNRELGLRVASALAGAVVTLAACGANTPAATATPQAPVATAAPATAAPEAPAAAPTATQTQSSQTVVEPTATIAEAAPAAPAMPTIVKLNLNTAEGDQFRTIPGVGNRMVREFLEYRPYLSIQQFRREIGKYVDAAQVAEYEKYVFVPIVPNEADAATLQQIPGVDAAIAEQLIAARPFADKAAFVTKLSEFVSAEQAAVGSAYVEGL